MDLGSFTSGLLTGLREGVEAALIVSIILAYLARTGNRAQFGRIWLGTAIAVLVSLVAGAVLFLTVGGLNEPYEQIFEGITLLSAAAVVTWMLFWMRRQSISVKGALHAALDRVMTQGTVFGLVALAFTAVIREGLETALFLVGLATSSQGGEASVLVGALAGLGVAVLLGAALYRGAQVVNLRTFFRWTGIGLIFIAAGLLSSAVHEFVEIGVIPFGGATAFDIAAVLPHKPIDGAPDGLPLIIGQFLRALLGYTSRPEVVTLVAWASYIVIVLALYLRPMGKMPARVATASAEVSAQG